MSTLLPLAFVFAVLLSFLALLVSLTKGESRVKEWLAKITVITVIWIIFVAVGYDYKELTQKQKINKLLNEPYSQPPNMEDLRGFWCDQRMNVVRVLRVYEDNSTTKVLFTHVYLDIMAPGTGFSWATINKDIERLVGNNCWMPYSEWDDLKSRGYIHRTNMDILKNIKRLPTDETVGKELMDDIRLYGEVCDIVVKDAWWHETCVFIDAEGTLQQKEDFQNKLNEVTPIYVVP